MKNYLILFACVLLLAACTENKRPPAVATKDTAVAGTPLTFPETDTTDEDTTGDAGETTTYYVVMADTGQGYYQLHDEMMRVSHTTGMTIDTMGRGYNEDKNLICLPKNDEDETYAGEYYPRRFPSVNLSLEYLDTYKEQSGETTIALVAGIFETKQSADSLLKVIKPVSRTSFVEKAEVYTGCMH